jgi:maltose-binding protein MalE
MRSFASFRLAALLALLPVLILGCAPKQPTGPREIVLWMQMDPEEHARLDANLADYMKAHPQVQVQAVTYDPETLHQQYQTAAAGGGGPQLLFGASDLVGPLSLLKLIRPLDETLPKGFFDRFVPQSLDTLEGHLWAAPDQVGNHLMLCYNKALVKQAPATHEEFLRVARANTGNGRYGFAMNVTEPFWLAPFLAGFGGWVMDAKGQPSLDSPAMRQALAYLDDLKNHENIMPKESDYQISETLFSEGKAAMTVNGPWALLKYRKSGVDLGIAPLWKLPNGVPAAPMTASKGYSINTNVKDSELPAVIELLTFLTSAAATKRDATKLGILPSNREAWDSAEIQSDPFLKESQVIYAGGRRMPIVPEMRVLWDVMRPGMQQVMNGSLTAEAAAKQMQASAVQQIAGMKQ